MSDGISLDERGLAAALDVLKAPALVRSQVQYTAGGGQWPPRPGWDRSPGLGSIRIWTDCDLLAWFDAAAADGVAVFGPTSRDEIAALAKAATAARSSGEGAKVLWGLDVVDAGDLRAGLANGAQCALWANDLVCVGPHLAREQLGVIQTWLDGGHDGHGRAETNSPVTVNGVECFSTLWLGAIA